MSLTLIGLAGLAVLSLFGLGYLVFKKCIVLTKSPNLTIVGTWGKDPTEILSPPWRFILYPFTQVMGILTTEVQRYNMPSCTITCRMSDPNGGAGIGKLTTKEVSLCYQFYFWPASEIRRRDPSIALPSGFSHHSQLLKFFEFVGFNPDGTIDFASMDEALKDSLQGAFSQASQRLHPLELDETINFPQERLDAIAAALQKEFWEDGLPVKVVSLQRNAPFEALDELGRSVAARAAALAALPTRVAEAQNERRLAVINAEAAREVAGIAVETERLRGEAEGVKYSVRVQAILTAFGLQNLPPADRLARYLSIEQLEVYRAMATSPSSKMFILPESVLTGIGGALRALTGGGHP